LSDKKIVLIIINYKKSELTKRLMKTLSQLHDLNSVHVIIVDNDSTPSSQADLVGCQQLNVSAEILFEKSNWGYFGGARKALAQIFAHIQSQAMPSTPEWVIISNSDIEFHQPNFFTRLLEFSNLSKTVSSPEVGIIGPRIESGLSATSQNPYLMTRPSATRMHFYKWCFRYQVTCFFYQLAGLFKSLLKKVTRHGTVASQSPDKPTSIYAAHGSFLIFSRAYFEAGANFDHEPFLFNEEITVAENCRLKNLKVQYEPSLCIKHEEHATMGLIPNPKTIKFLSEASAFAADKYFPLGRPRESCTER
jgi:GT2 family glycosyltransferase